MTDTSELTGEILKRKNLIVRNLQEVLGDEKLNKQLLSGKNIHVYWGTATTGRPHVGYLVPIQKIADLLHAGIKVTILLADMHAFLDNLKSTYVLLENRVLYYEHIIKALLASLDVPIDKLHFVKGSTYQLTEEYTQSVLKLCGCVSQRDALKAGAEVVKQVKSPLLSGLLYPLLQALDEQFLKVDGQIGGVDQRKIFILAEEQLPKLKFGKRFHLMNPMVPGLAGSKMSSSDTNTKIDLLDSPELVREKINSSVCVRNSENNETAENGLLLFFKFVVMPIVQNSKSNINNAECIPKEITLCNKHYSTFEEIESDFQAGIIADTALKTYLANFLNNILSKIHERCDDNEMKQIIAKAYPTLSEISDLHIFEKSKTTENIPLDAEIEKKYSAFVRDLECINSERLRRAFAEKRSIRVLYRCSAKGRVTLAHFAALIRLKMVRDSATSSGVSCECAVLISDLGAFLDNAKCPWSAMEGRCKYYKMILRQFMKIIELENVEVYFSKDYEYNKDYVLDMYKAVSNVTRDETALVPGNTLACHLCPVYFALDNLHFDSGASFGGVVDVLLIGESQRKFAELSAKVYQSLSGRVPSTLIVPEIVGMDGQRMSATRPDFHLDPLDTAKQIRQKVAKSFCEPGNLKDNVALRLVETVLFPMMRVCGGDTNFIIERTAENGGTLTISDMKSLFAEFESERLHPADLKSALINQLNQKIFTQVQEGLYDVIPTLLREAFPPAPKGGAKKK